jgi:hypothetical protein
VFEIWGVFLDLVLNFDFLKVSLWDVHGIESMEVLGIL